MPEFVPFPKLPRLNRSMIVTEKVDGTNACIIIEDAVDGASGVDLGYVGLWCQSRKRRITPEQDNQGFARWAYENKDALIALLGPGRHFGEWYGSGINGNRYGLDHKRFCLFDTDRYENSDAWAGLLSSSGPVLIHVGEAFVHTAPVLYRGAFNTWKVTNLIAELDLNGSQLPGVAHDRHAEGVVAWHNAARIGFKVTCENDERPKGSNEAA